MKVSYKWLKSYIPDLPQAEKLADVFTFYLSEVESIENIKDDTVYDIKILPDRAHDLLSHRGIAKEIASLLDLKFIDPVLMYKVPAVVPTSLEINVKSDKCRRYMGRIVRNIKIGPSPEWMTSFLEMIGQRSINNIVDAANIVMYDCGQPTHAFDLAKVASDKLIVRDAREGENMVTLDNRDWKLGSPDLVITDEKKVLAVAGIKGGKFAEVGGNTKNILLEVANFDPVSIHKTAQSLNIFTDARKRFENDLSPELCDLAMQEFSALIFELCPEASFEEIVDIYSKKQSERKLVFRKEKVSNILGLELSTQDVKNILDRYGFSFTENDGTFEAIIPPMRLDLLLEEDMAEEIGRIIGYDKIPPKSPKIDFQLPADNTYAKIVFARSKLLNEGYGEVITYSFRDEGEIEVLASASNKKFLRANLDLGIKESLKLNQLNIPLLDMDEIKIFEIGTVFKKGGEEIRVVYADKNGTKEATLDEFSEDMPKGFSFSLSKTSNIKFKMWSLYPFISRDVAIWVPKEVESNQVYKVLKENAGDLLIKDPYLFDEFKKDDKISYAFRLVFQSYERTLKSEEIDQIMSNITNKIKEKTDWQIR